MNVINLGTKRIVFLGDTHALNAHPGGLDKPGTMDAVKAAFVAAKDIAGDDGLVIQLGDLFDLARPDMGAANSLPNTLKHVFADTLPVMGISGNHDYPSGGAARQGKGATGDSINSLVQEASHGAYVLVDGFTIELDGIPTRVHCLPFYRHEEDFIQRVRGMADAMPSDDGYTNLLVCHQDMRPVINTSQVDPSNMALFDRFDQIFNGHLHDPCEYPLYSGGRWVNVGAGCVTKSRDWEVRPRVAVFDSKGISFVPLDTNFYLNGNWPRPDTRREADAMEGFVSVAEVKDATPQERAAYVAGVIDGLPENLIPGAEAEAPVKRLVFDQVAIEGFRSWAEETTYQLDLQGGLNVIKARAGAGKTSLFEAVYWCLTGDTLKQGGKQEDIPSEPHLRGPGWKGTRVQVWLKLDGQSLIVSRHIDFKGDTFGRRGGDSLTLAEYLQDQRHDGDVVDSICIDAAEIMGLPPSEVDSKSKLTAALCAFLGLSRETFTLSVLFDPQRCRIAQGSEEDKRNTFEPLMGTGWIDRLRENAQEAMEKARVEEGVALGRVTDADRAHTRAQDTLEATTLQAAKEVEAAESDWQDKEANRAADLHTWQNEVEALNFRKEELEVRASEARVQVAEADRKLAGISPDALRLALNEARQERSRTVGVIDAISLHETRKESKEQAAKALKETEDSIPNVQSRLAKLEAELAAIDLEALAEAVHKVELDEAEAKSKVREATAEKRRLDTLPYPPEIDALRQELQALLEKARRAEQEEALLQGGVYKAAEVLTQQEKAFNENVCSACGQVVDKLHAEKSLADAKKALADAKAKLNGASIDTSRFGREVEEKQKQYLGATSAVSAKRAEETAAQLAIIDESKATSKELEGKTLKAVGELEEAKSTARELRLKVKELERLLVVHTQKADALKQSLSAGDDVPAPEISRTDAMAAFEEADAKLNEAATRLAEMDTAKAHAERKVLRLKEDLEALQTELDAATKDLHRANVRVETLSLPTSDHREAVANRCRRDVAGAESQLAEAKELLEKLAQDHALKAAHLAKLKETVTKCAANGPLRRKIVASRLDRVNHYAAAYARAVGTSVRVSLDAAGKYVVEVRAGGHDRKASKASTGQLSIANLILVQAVAALAREKVLDTNLLLIDEPFGNVDPATIRDLSPALTLGGGVSVHCITHAVDMDMAGANLILIEGGVEGPSRFA